MIEPESTHFRILRETVTGQRGLDEKTFASVAVLSERLEHLRTLDCTFEGVSFSPAVEAMRKRHNAVAVG